MARQYDCSEIISEGLLLAGDTSLTARAVVWLNQWLRSQYRAWPWPFLQSRASGLTLSAGSGSMVVGAGQGGVTPEIQRVIDPVYLYNSAKSIRGTLRIQQLNSGPMEEDIDARLSTRTGLPMSLKLRPSNTTYGRWLFIFDPIPDAAYLFSFDYLQQPDDVATGTTGGTSIPLYPNDQTCVQAVYARALQYLSDERAIPEMERLRLMCLDDRVKYGQSPGVNELWGMDPNTFKGS
jgi:hypothetical protein